MAKTTSRSSTGDLQLVIFDCDGVLVDSEVISNEVLARALTEEGLPTTLTQARRDYQGLLLEEIDSRAQAKLGRPLAKDWLERYERDRATAFRRKLRAVPGAAEAVKRIRAAGVPVCVASQGKLKKTRLSLRLTQLDALGARLTTTLSTDHHARRRMGLQAGGGDRVGLGQRFDLALR